MNNNQSKKLNEKFTPGWKITIIICAITIGLMLIEIAKIDNYITGQPFKSVNTINKVEGFSKKPVILNPEQPINNDSFINSDKNDGTTEEPWTRSEAISKGIMDYSLGPNFYKNAEELAKAIKNTENDFIKYDWQKEFLKANNITQKELTKYGEILFNKTNLSKFGYIYYGATNVNGIYWMLRVKHNPLKMVSPESIIITLFDNVIDDQVRTLNVNLFTIEERLELVKYQELLRDNYYNWQNIIKDSKVFNIDNPQIDYSKNYHNPIYEDENVTVFKWENKKREKNFGSAYQPY